MRTTGLVGLPVHHSAKPELLSLYSRITHSLQRFPESSVYRQGTLALFNKRIEFIEKTEDLKKIEDEFQLGQMEELIEQAQEELKLIKIMEENKPWESLQETPLPGQWTNQ
ncbi:ndufa5, NADH-ubiquinone oxidoreductase subunit [Terramyces sp. JEL0728]|nr:ndufa5, NADH-ubiquinone oxidoreductase subunit [Terramyces sp. JEL0728]